VASITKMMTFYTVINIIEEYKIDPSQTFISVCRQATSIIGTSADLREDDILSIRQLFYGMMLPSGNDAAFLLAEYFG
jgi:D-alanyl-D-alanine carboxypeptidase